MIRTWIGLHPLFFIQQGKSAEMILRSPEYVIKSVEYDISEYWIGQGLLNSPKEKWEKRRKLVNHSFHTQILDGYLPIFNEQADILVQRLTAMAGKGSFEVEKYTSHFALDIICETTMGVKMRIQEDFNSEFVKCINGMITIYMLRSTLPWMNNQFLFNLTKHRKDEIAYVKASKEFTSNVIKQRRKLRDKEKSEEKGKTEDAIIGQKRRLATLDLLLEAKIDGKLLTDSDILEEVMIICIAGHDTAASSLAWTLSLLGHSPEIQKRVHEEVDDVLGDTDRPVTHDDLAQMRYLEAVLKESLRLYPTVPFFGRKLDEDIIINGYTLPAKTSIMFTPFFIHRDSEVFPDPEKFDPERFLTSKVYTQYEYMPFSAGPRNCIGHRFALIENRVALVHILKNFKIISHTKHEDVRHIIGPVLHSHNGIHISLEKRT